MPCAAGQFTATREVKTLFDALELTYDWEQLVVAAVVASVLSYASLGSNGYTGEGGVT